MTGRALNWYWKAMWAVVSPLLIISLLLFYLSDYILTGTLQYQAWDASQVPHLGAPKLTREHRSSIFCNHGAISMAWASYFITT